MWTNIKFHCVHVCCEPQSGLMCWCLDRLFTKEGWLSSEASVSCMCVFSLMFLNLFLISGTRQYKPWWHGGHLRQGGHIGWLSRPPPAGLTPQFGLILLHAFGCRSVLGSVPAVHTYVSWGRLCHAAWTFDRNVVLHGLEPGLVAST